MRSIFQRFYFFFLANALNVASEGVDRSYVSRETSGIRLNVIGFPITGSHYGAKDFEHSLCRN